MLFVAAGLLCLSCVSPARERASRCQAATQQGTKCKNPGQPPPYVCVRPVQVSDQEQLLGNLKYLAKEAAERQAGLQARIDRCARAAAIPHRAIGWLRPACRATLNCLVWRCLEPPYLL